jgi:hypothetical protein
VSSAAPLPCAGSRHLDVLVAELDGLVARLRTVLATADTEAVVARRASEDAATAVATLRLDGGLRATEDGGTERPGTWLDALGGTAADRAAHASDDPDVGAERDAPDGAPDAATLARLAELERAGVAAGIAAVDLAAAFGRTSADAGGLGTALAQLHGRITAGLVAEERAGRLRRGERVVHDASVGRVLFFPTDAALLPDAWDALLRHVTGSGAGGAAARRPPAVRAALLHLELLRHQPFDAANGRLARAATRLALLADDLLPAGLGAPDAVLTEDPLGYHEEVGASLRRRDATHWVERALEAHGIALGRTLAVFGAQSGMGATVGTADGPPADLEETFTLGDVVALHGSGSDAARERCSTWVVAGHAERVVGSAGLRLRRAPQGRR